MGAGSPPPPPTKPEGPVPEGPPTVKAVMEQLLRDIDADGSRTITKDEVIKFTNKTSS